MSVLKTLVTNDVLKPRRKGTSRAKAYVSDEVLEATYAIEAVVDAAFGGKTVAVAFGSKTVVGVASLLRRWPA
jgi:hypothetical protein